MNYIKMVNDAVQYIESNLHRNLSLEELASHYYISPTHFYRIFRAVTNQTVKSYILRRKLSEAAIALRKTDRNVVEIAFQYGFNSHEQFTRDFQRVFHVTPSRYRKESIYIPLTERMDIVERDFRNKNKDIIVDYCCRELKEIKLLGKEVYLNPWCPCELEDLIREVNDFWREYVVRGTARRWFSVARRDSSDPSHGFFFYGIAAEVLDYERASEIIRQSGGGALTICACRHKASHLGKTCAAGAPMETCTILGNIAKWFVHKGMARPATVDELLQVLDQTEKLGLAHLGDNVLKQPFFICHCCSCCCTALRPTVMYGKLFVNPSNFIPVLAPDNCAGCGTCAEKCVVKVIAMREAESGIEVPEINEQLCLGCGVCASACPTGALTMSRRPVLRVPPENAMDLQTRVAREKNKI